MTTQILKTVSQLYEEDYCLWLEATLVFLKEKQVDKLDLEHLIEEIAALVKSEQREIKSRLVVLIAHLLKWKYKPERISLSRSSWMRTINEQRRQLKYHLEDSPSLRPFIANIFFDCYSQACRETNKETNLPLSTFPSDSPFTLEQVLDFDYLP
jgi:hypothetical protein